MSSNTSSNSEVTLFHPLLQDRKVDSCNWQDGLNNAAATLYMLADLFGDADMDRYPVLDSSSARRGMFLQLIGVAGALEAIEEFLGREAEEASEKREAERQARTDASRAEEDRIALAPEVLEKRAILAGAFFDVFDKVLSDAKTAEGATA